MNTKVLISCSFVALLSLGHCCAQGTLTPIAFEGPALRSGKLLREYDEAGMSFTAFGTGLYDWGLYGWVSGRWWQLPDDGAGSAYMVPGAMSTVTITSLSGQLFGLVAVDLAEEGSYAPHPVTVHFTGYRSDGSSVTRDFTTDGVIDGTGPLADFQTFYFGSEFQGFSRVEIPGAPGWSMDNLVVSIPEPGTGALIVTAGLILGFVRSQMGRKPNSRAQRGAPANAGDRLTNYRGSRARRGCAFRYARTTS